MIRSALHRRTHRRRRSTNSSDVNELEFVHDPTPKRARLVGGLINTGDFTHAAATAHAVGARRSRRAGRWRPVDGGRSRGPVDRSCALTNCHKPIPCPCGSGTTPPPAPQRTRHATRDDHPESNVLSVSVTSTHQETTAWDLQRAIREARLRPVERDTLYRPIERDGSTWRLSTPAQRPAELRQS